jgi:hypothetical protein
MLTLLDAICLAGARTGCNDDAFGLAGSVAWVIDGATDLADPLTGAASDASWIARTANAWLHGRADLATAPLDRIFEDASAAMLAAFSARVDPASVPRWRWPVAAMLIARESPAGLEIADLGDCRLFAEGVAFAGMRDSKDLENAAAAVHASDASGVRYKAPAALDILRRQRDALYDTVGVFGIDPACSRHVRVRTVRLDRPAHVIMATDGFASLVDVYEAHDPESLVSVALGEGLAGLAAELRAIETADADSAMHPRWKRSDDATALLLRLD